MIDKEGRLEMLVRDVHLLNASFPIVLRAGRLEMLVREVHL